MSCDSAGEAMNSDDEVDRENAIIANVMEKLTISGYDYCDDRKPRDGNTATREQLNADYEVMMNTPAVERIIKGKALCE